MSAPKFDKETVVWLRDEFMRLVETIPGGWGAIAGAMLGTLKRLAAEAEAREPDVADWLAAAMRSKYGPPLAVITFGGQWNMEWNAGGQFTLDRNGARFYRRGGRVDLATPAELSRELDLLAEVKP